MKPDDTWTFADDNTVTFHVPEGIGFCVKMRHKRRVFRSDEFFLKFHIKYHRFYFKSFLKQLRCIWTGHEMGWKTYPHPKMKFDAWECGKCDLRFAVRNFRKKVVKG